MSSRRSCYRLALKHCRMAQRPQPRTASSELQFGRNMYMALVLSGSLADLVQTDAWTEAPRCTLAIMQASTKAYRQLLPTLAVRSMCFVAASSPCASRSSCVPPQHSHLCAGASTRKQTLCHQTLGKRWDPVITTHSRQASKQARRPAGFRGRQAGK